MKILAAPLAVLAIAATATGAMAVELRLSIETPPGHIRNMASERWATQIEEMSDGDITVEVFPAGQLYDSAGAVRALASGALDLSIQASPTLSQFEPNLSVITLPMFFGASREDVRTILDGPLGDELYDLVEQKGIVVPEAGQFEFAPNNSAYTTDSEITDFAGLSGVKLATPPSPVVVQILEAMDANPVATPRTEIVMQLTQGQIDGMGSVTDLTISGGKLWEAGISYAFADNAGWGTYIPLVSKATMDSLSEDQQQIIEEAWSEVVGWARQEAEDQLESARQLNMDNGITYHEPSEEAVTEIRQSLIDAQGAIVENSGMNSDFVSRVQEALSEL